MKNLRASVLICFAILLDCLALFSQTWNSGTDLPTGRYNHASATGPDGNIYIAGGQSSFNQPLNTVLKFDPLNGTAWTAVSSMVNPRSVLALVTGTDGYIYAIGGMNGSISVKCIFRSKLTHLI